MMSVLKYIRKTFTTHVLAAVMILLMTVLVAILKDQLWYQIVISVGMLGFYWVFVSHTAARLGYEDAKNNDINYMKPLFGALVINIPNIIFIVLDIAVGIPSEFDLFKLCFRYWNAGALNFLLLTKDSIWTMLGVVLMYAAGFTLIYCKGITDKQKSDSTLKGMLDKNIQDNDSL